MSTKKIITGDVIVREDDRSIPITSVTKGKVLLYAALGDKVNEPDAVTPVTIKFPYGQVDYNDLETFDNYNNSTTGVGATGKLVDSIRYLLSRRCAVRVFFDNTATASVSEATVKAAFEALLRDADENHDIILAPGYEFRYYVDDVDGTPTYGKTISDLFDVDITVLYIADSESDLEAIAFKDSRNAECTNILSVYGTSLVSGLADTNVEISTSVVVAELASRNIRAGVPYKALYGQNALLDVVSPKVSLSRANVQKFNDVGINTLINKQGIGVFLRSQFTLTTHDVSLARGSVRLLVNKLKDGIKSRSEAYIGDFNEATTWSRWNLEIANFLRPNISVKALLKYDVRAGVPDTMTAAQAQHGWFVGVVDLYPTSLIEKVVVFTRLNTLTGEVSFTPPVE